MRNGEKVFTMRVRGELLDALNLMAEDCGLTRSDLIRHLLTDAVMQRRECVTKETMQVLMRLEDVITKRRELVA
jgi:metal-responsive CopG/Arc/MetJ family transcriptional regulator